MNVLATVFEEMSSEMSTVFNYRLYTVTDHVPTYWASVKGYKNGFTVRVDRKAVARGLTRNEAFTMLNEQVQSRGVSVVNVEVNGVVNGEDGPVRRKDVATSATKVVARKGPYRDENGKFISRDRAVELGLA